MKNAIFLALIVLVTGCAAVKPSEPVLVYADQCRAVEGAYVKMNHKGQPVYKYICNGKSVWMTQL